MKRLLSILTALSLTLTFIPSFAGAQVQQERVLILFKDKVDKTIVTKAKGKVNREYKHVPALSITLPSTAIKGIQNNPNVKAVEKDIVLKVKSQTADWGITRTEAPKAWGANFTGKGVKIAVVDTGIARHDDLVIPGGISFVSYTTSFHDDNGHGTHVAGIIGARNNSIGSVGIAPESDIYAVKVLDQHGSGYLSDIVAGVDWSINNKMDIINLSLGTTTHSSTLQQVVDKAYSQNILIVAAAGNNGSSDGSGDTVNYPARYSSVIAVSATDSSDRRASFSATGSTIEVAAPGVSVLSTYLNNQYGRMSGTSMAAPYVAGNLALLIQANSSLSAKELRTKLQQGVVDLGTAGIDHWYGYGLIQAPKAEQIIEPAPAQETVLYDTKTTVVTNKSVYKAGEKINVTMTAYDHNGKVLIGANARVVVYDPLGTGKVYKGITDSRGQFKVAHSTSMWTSLKGTYEIESQTSKEGYRNSISRVKISVR
ncbi:S8 family serine peptidase [Bacillus salitolerans]|uniref:S8 family serine peptidase n=1 Tax=Bacillus salitolerans TaxID=1437434 RepID=A0ABW4LWR9_9BACI